jgi:glycosyltransferase involved in cell wall biosynthesis
MGAMMKKQLLFVIPSLTTGGGQKSLINLLNQLDYTKHNVDLLLFNKSGEFLESLPKKVNLLDLSKESEFFSHSLLKSVGAFIKKGNLKFAYSRLQFSLTNRVIKNSSLAEQHSWKYRAMIYKPLEKVYDVAIGYLEKSSIYFVVDKVKAKKKIGWIHTNYTNSGMDPEFDKPYFENLDQIVTVSEECRVSLLTQFIELKSRICVIENILSPTMIRKLSEVKLETIYEIKSFMIITLARLSPEKGIDLAIEACKLLRNQEYSINWLVLGDGSERKVLEKRIQAYGLEDHFKLLGVKTNPYPFLKQADVYVQPSRYEGKSMAIEEAKILNKPIVITNFETAKDTIIDEQNGLIVDINEEALANGIKRLMKDLNLKQRIINQLSLERLGTEEEVKKVYAIL